MGWPFLTSWANSRTVKTEGEFSVVQALFEEQNLIYLQTLLQNSYYNKAQCQIHENIRIYGY